VDLPAAAKALGLRLLVLDIANDKDIETAIASAVKGGADAVFVGAGAFLNSHRGQLLTLATHHVLPTSFIVRAPVVAGGLMSYGPSQNNAYRQAGSYVAMILNGKKPADLPVAQSTRFEFVLNLKTAKALGLNIPPALLAVADEVIE
jgi:putative ABC transport system substrate-binding protein